VGKGGSTLRILEILESEAGTRKDTPNWSEIERQSELPWENTIPIEIETEEVWIGEREREERCESYEKSC
jgi:hypothetical protein